MDSPTPHSDKTAFVCQMCGQCCEGQGGIVVTLRDQKRLSSFLELSLKSFQEAYTEGHGSVRVLTSCSSNRSCVFFTPETGCTVHSHKPDLCRAWPFFRGNLIDEDSFHMAKDGCPGINTAVTHDEFVKQGLLYLKKQGLIHHDRPDAPRALVVQDLLAGC